MHSRGVIHRDLKPENLLLDDKMRLKVTDFGTAKLLDREIDKDGNELDSYPQNVRASSFVGTAEYVSPELLADKYATKSCDMWAYGCILYQMVAGRPPFTASNEYQIFRKVVKLQYSFPPRFPTVLRDLIKHLLVLAPERRYTTSQVKRHPFFQGVEWTRNAIWKTPHPRLQPYTYSTKIPTNIPPFGSRAYNPGVNGNGNISHNPYISNLARNKTSANSRSSPNLVNTNQTNSAHPPLPKQASGNGLSNKSVVSAAAGAAAALAKPPSSISPYYTPTQPHSYSSGTNNNQQIKAQPVSKAATRAHVNTSTSNSTTLPQSGNNANATARSKPSNTALVASNLAAVSDGYTDSNKQKQGTQISSSEGNSSVDQKKNFKAALTSATIATNSASNTSASQNSTTIKPMEIPPLTKADKDFSSLLTHKDERILKIGQITMSTTSSTNGSLNDSDTNDKEMPDFNEKEPSRISRLFAGSRKKKRVLFVTTFGRLVVVNGIEDKKVQLDIRVVSPQVVVREFARNKKTFVGTFAVEAHGRVFTFEDPSGSSDWMKAINKAKEFVENQEQLAAAKTHQTAAAAAMAAAASSAMRLGNVGMGGVNGSTSRRRSSDIDSMISQPNHSVFLRRSEERKQRNYLN